MNWRGAIYAMDDGDINIDTANADELRKIIMYETARHESEIERLRAQRDQYLDMIKPRCFLCRVFDAST